MKFGQKIFLITFVFVAISINIIGIIIINNNHKMRISAKMDSDIQNINNIKNTLKFYDITNVNLTRRENTYYEISAENNIVYTNIFFDISGIREKIVPSQDNIKAVISNEFLFMSVKEENYNIILAEDITEVFNERREQIYFFIRVSVIFSFIIAFCLYIVIYLLTGRIGKLSRTMKKISNGNYSARVQDLGKDEVGKLAKSFNKMAKSIEDTIEEIKRVSENRQNFIHNITHEIRTPLTSIIGYSSLIKSGKVSDSEKIIEYNNKIYEEGNYLNLISQRLMDIVLLDNKKIELEYVDFSAVLEELIENLKNDYTEVKFFKAIPKGIGFLSDKVLLHSLVLNIIKNAIMAYENKNEAEVFISLEKINEKTILLKIIDRGKGMSEEQLERIKEPFYTLNKDRNRQISGMGLGLPLCVKICEVLNGKLEIESKLGQGTCVNIEFTI